MDISESVQQGSIDHLNQYLIDIGDLFRKYDRYRTALEFACDRGYAEWIPFLLGLNTDANRPDAYSFSPLHLAAMNGRHECVELLLRHGVNPTPRTCSGWTPLHYACENGHFKCVRLLLEHGADREALNINRNTPLDVCQFNYPVIKSLIMGGGMATKNARRYQTIQ